MKYILLFVISMTTGIASETLEDFLWKKRLLVVAGDPAGLRRELAKFKPELATRDVKVFFLNDPEVDQALARRLTDRLKVRASDAEVLLLGKDGRTTLRWRSDEFTVTELFAKIDAMPMRQAEIRARKARG